MKSYQDLWEAEHAEKVALKQQTLAAFCSLRQAHKAQVDTLRGKLGALEEQLVDVGAACYAMQAWARHRAHADGAPCVKSVSFAVGE
jgi:hypothetical protein